MTICLRLAIAHLTYTPTVNQDRTIFRITLDDAVEVMKDLKVEDGERIPDETRKSGSLLSRRDFRDNDQSSNRHNNGREKRQKTHIPTGQGPKAVSNCHNCREPNHWYRDPECIYNVIKDLISGREIPSDTVQKLSPTVRELFKDENGRYKSKVPVNQIVDVIGNKTGNIETNIVSNAKSNNSYFR